MSRGSASLLEIDRPLDEGKTLRRLGHANGGWAFESERLHEEGGVSLLICWGLHQIASGVLLFMVLSYTKWCRAMLCAALAAASSI